MTDDPADLDHLVTCLSACAGLPIDPAHLADVSLNLGRLLDEGRKLMAVSLPTEMEPLPVFRP
jgi:hypothetical protein